MLKNPANRTDIEIKMADITHLTDGIRQRVSLMKSIIIGGESDRVDRGTL